MEGNETDQTIVGNSSAYTATSLHRYTVIFLYRYIFIPLYFYTVIPLHHNTATPPQISLRSGQNELQDDTQLSLIAFKISIT